MGSESKKPNRRDALKTIATMLVGTSALSSQGNGIKALVFDAYGTLFDVNSVVARCEQMFPGKGQVLSNQWRAKQLEYSWLLSLMDRYVDFWQVTDRALTYACHAMNLSCTSEQHSQLMDEYLRVKIFPDVVPALKQLATIPLSILSNGSPRMLQAAVEHNGLTKTFQFVISVDEIKMYKPNRRVYALATQKLKLDAASIAFVSSNSFDAQGAKSFGFRTYWVRRADATLDELGAPPDRTVQSLADLL